MEADEAGYALQLSTPKICRGRAEAVKAFR